MDFDEEIKKVHITSSLTSQKIINLMENYPNLKTITCSKSIYKRISPDYIEALNKLDINVKIEYNWGKKSKYAYKEDKVLNYVKKGYKVKEISKKLDIPLNTVYNILRKKGIKMNNYKRKYDLETRERIKNLKKEGKSPKEISKEFNIPIRSVYYILNKK